MTPEEIIVGSIVRHTGNDETLQREIIAALDAAGYEIREKGTLYAGPLKATAERDKIIVRHKDGRASWSTEVYFDGLDVMCRAR